MVVGRAGCVPSAAARRPPLVAPIPLAARGLPACSPLPPPPPAAWSLSRDRALGRREARTCRADRSVVRRRGVDDVLRGCATGARGVAVAVRRRPARGGLAASPASSSRPYPKRRIPPGRCSVTTCVSSPSFFAPLPSYFPSFAAPSLLDLWGPLPFAPPLFALPSPPTPVCGCSRVRWPG